MKFKFINICYHFIFFTVAILAQIIHIFKFCFAKMTPVTNMAGEVVCKLNLKKRYLFYKHTFGDDFDVSYCTFQDEIRISPFVSEMSKLNQDFHIIQNENIIWCSKYPRENYFKQKLNLIGPFQCIFTTLSDNPMYSLLFELLETTQCKFNYQLVQYVKALPEEYRDNKDFMSILCAYSCFPCVRYTSSKLQQDKDFLFSICEKNEEKACFVAMDCSEELKNDESFIYELIDYCADAILSCSNSILKNKELLLYAVEKGGNTDIINKLYELGDDKYIIFALQAKPWLYEYAPEHIRKSMYILANLLTISGLSLKYACIYLKQNHPIVKIAVMQNGLALQFADEELRREPAIVKAAVKQNGIALEFTNEILKNDESTVKIAVANNGMALKFANPRFRSNKEIALIAVRKTPLVYELIDDKIKYNKEFKKFW